MKPTPKPPKRPPVVATTPPQPAPPTVHIPASIGAIHEPGKVFS